MPNERLQTPMQGWPVYLLATCSPNTIAFDTDSDGTLAKGDLFKPPPPQRFHQKTPNLFLNPSLSLS